MSDTTEAGGTARVSAEWLEERRKTALSTRTFLLWWWVASYLVPLFLLLSPWLGLRANPNFLHGHGRAFTTIVAIVYAVGVTVLNHLQMRKSNKVLSTIDDILARGPSGYRDDTGYHPYPEKDNETRVGN